MANHPLHGLAHVHRVVTQVAGHPCEVYVFDHHRSAFAPWVVAAREHGQLTLLSLDRHLDLERPAARLVEGTPSEALDAWARESLSPRNDDHVRAAMEAGAVARAVLVARSHEPSDLAELERTHELTVVRTVADVAGRARALLQGDGPVALDLDLDCFTTLSDADPEEVVPWDAEHVDAFLRPPGSQALWRDVLARTRVITLAREPYHCGGLARGARLWLAFSEVFFGRLLGVPEP